MAAHSEPSGRRSSVVVMGRAISTTSPSCHSRRTSAYDDGLDATSTGVPLTVSLNAPAATHDGWRTRRVKEDGFESAIVMRLLSS